MMARQELSKKIRNAVIDRDFACVKCGRRDGFNAQIHHIVAVQDGGTDDLSNLAMLCPACHSEWHIVESSMVLTWEEWLEYPNLSTLMAFWRVAGGIDDKRKTWQAIRAGRMVLHSGHEVALFSAVYNGEIEIS